MYDEGDRLSDSRVGNSLHPGNRIRFASEWTIVEEKWATAGANWTDKDR